MKISIVIFGAFLLLVSLPVFSAEVDNDILADDALLLEDIPDEPESTNSAAANANVGADFMKALVQMMVMENNKPEVDPGPDFEEVLKEGDDPADDVLLVEPEDDEPEDAPGKGSESVEDPFAKGIENMFEAMFTEMGKGLDAALSAPDIIDADGDKEAEELFDLDDLPEDEEVIEE